MGYAVASKLIKFCPVCGARNPEKFVLQDVPTYFKCRLCKTEFEVGDHQKRIAAQTTNEKPQPLDRDKAHQMYDRYVAHRKKLDLPIVSLEDWLVSKKRVLR